MRFKDIYRAIYSNGLASTTTEPLIAVGGIDASSSYRSLALDTAGNLLVSQGASGGGGPASQSSSWTVSIRDSSGNPVLATNTFPIGTEQGWITRPIFSGTCTISGAVRVFDSSGNSAIATNTFPVGTEQAWITRPIFSGTCTISGAVRNFDSLGNPAISTNTNPIGTEQGWIARIAGAQAIQGATVPSSPIVIGAEGRTTDGTAVATGQLIRILSDSLGKIVTLPGAVNNLHQDGEVLLTTTATSPVIATIGTGVRIVLQSILVTNSGTGTAKVILSGGPNNRTFGFVVPGGRFDLQAGGAALYITSASTALFVKTDITSTTEVFCSGYSIGN